MNTPLTRRNLLKVAGAGLALPLFARSGFAQTAPLKVAFAFGSAKNDNGWTSSHWAGAQKMMEKFGAAVDVTFVENVAFGPESERVIRDLAQQGNRLIFSGAGAESTMKIARMFPDVIFEQVESAERAPNVGTYSLRYHEGHAVMGLIAGHLSKTGKIGCISSFPVSPTILAVNAFTLMARRVNPAIEVTMNWISTWGDPAKEADASRAFIDQGADILVLHNDGPMALQIAEERGIIGGFGLGVDMAAFAPQAQLSAVIYNWEHHYINTVQKVMDGTWASADHWLGMSEDSVIVGPYSSKIPADVVASVEDARQKIATGTMSPFSGPIIDNTGVEVVAAGQVLDGSDLRVIKWFAEGITA